MAPYGPGELELTPPARPANGFSRTFGGMPDNANRERIELRTPDGSRPAPVRRPSSGGGPGILLLQEVFGVSDCINPGFQMHHAQASALARERTVAFVDRHLPT